MSLFAKAQSTVDGGTGIHRKMDDDLSFFSDNKCAANQAPCRSHNISDIPRDTSLQLRCVRSHVAKQSVRPHVDKQCVRSRVETKKNTAAQAWPKICGGSPEKKEQTCSLNCLR